MLKFTTFLLRAICTTSFVLQRARWSAPATSDSEEGLGRGITFSIDPQLCDTLQPRFLEYIQGWRSLAPCEEIEDTIGRALSSWSSNSKSVSFYNVSHLCLPSDCANSSELYITARRGVLPDSPLAVGATELELSLTPPRGTNGLTVHSDQSIQRARIELVAHDGICWYLDDHACAAAVGAGFDVEALVVGMYFLFLTIAISLLAFTIYHLVKKLTKGKAYQDKRKVLSIVLRESDSVLRINALVFFFIFPNIFYFSFFRPCFTCFPFEAVVLHHVGLALGLNDLTNHASSNLVSSASLTGSDCAAATRPQDEAGAVVSSSPFFEDPSPSPGRDCDYSRWWECENRRFSAMLAPDPLHVGACVTSDDVAGLNVLYPSCNGHSAVPQCVSTGRNTAWWRFMLLFGIPTVLVLVLLPVSTALTRRFIRSKACYAQAYRNAYFTRRLMQMEGPTIAGGRHDVQYAQGTGRFAAALYLHQYSC